MDVVHYLEMIGRDHGSLDIQVWKLLPKLPT